MAKDQLGEGSHIPYEHGAVVLSQFSTLESIAADVRRAFQADPKTTEKEPTAYQLAPDEIDPRPFTEIIPELKEELDDPNVLSVEGEELENPAFTPEERIAQLEQGYKNLLDDFEILKAALMEIPGVKEAIANVQAVEVYREPETIELQSTDQPKTKSRGAAAALLQKYGRRVRQ